MAHDESALLQGLTDVQRQAVTHVDGPLLVLAGPGSGKTTVVTRRVAYLIAQGIPAWQILALTFTNKAAGEMRDRIGRLLPEDVPGRRGLTIATFHSFCARLLRRYAGAVEGANLSPRFTIYDSADQRDAMKRALKEAGLDSKQWTPGSVAAAISTAKNQLLDASAYARGAGDFYTRTIAKVYAEYAKILKRNDALDFDDLLLVTANLLRVSEPVRRELQQRFQYILIDEYQDTNHAQFVIAHALAAQHGNICVVGDPDQSIYAWRGADIRNILDFETQYPSARVIPLGQNFRSTAHIVDTAAHLIQNNRRRKHKKLFTELGEGDKPLVVRCFDEHDEARLVVDECRKRHDEQQVPWREMAVLYRINALSRVMEDEFRAASIPYVIARGTAFYERKEVKDALAYLRVVANPNDEVSLRRVINTPTRGIGNSTVDRVELFAVDSQLSLLDSMRRAAQIPGLDARRIKALERFAAMVDSWREAAGGTAMSRTELLQDEARAPLAALVERVVRESGMEELYRKSKAEEDLERLENLEELINAAADFMPQQVDPERLDEMSVLDTLQAFLESVALVSDADAIDPAKGAVTLMTLHAAKGLEFEVVALAGLEEGLLPHTRATESEAEVEEERRLLFVGITRAKRHLLLTHVATRTVRGLPERTVPSHFLGELPEQSTIVHDRVGERGSGWEGAEDIEWGRSSYDAGADYRASRLRPGRTTGGGGGALADQFPIGCTVRHPKFGLGRVEIVTRRVSGAAAQVAFASVGRKTLILEYAKLERVDD